MTDVRSRLDGLSAEKRALLERRLLRMRQGAGTSDVISRRDPQLPCPLSFPQTRLWFLDQWEPGAPTYNAAVAVRLRGPLDLVLLEHCLRAVVERHEALRTVFRDHAGVPTQTVLERWTLDLDLIEAPGATDDEIHGRLRAAAREPFDLANDVMLRATVLRLGGDDHVLLFGEHHVAFDGWSDEIMFREVAELYRSVCEGRDPVLPELPIQYGDFAAWQRAAHDAGALDEHLAYWSAHLAGAPTRIDLPTDMPRPVVQTFGGAHLPVSMPASLAERMVELARSEAATPYMGFLGLWGLALYRLTGQDDVLVGTPIANRDRPEVENLIGFFANTLVLRLRSHGNPTFRELLRRVRQTALEAYTHQAVPFEKIVETLKPVRHPGYNPLVQVNFRVQATAPAVLELPGIASSPVAVDVGFSRFDLALELQLSPEGIGGYFEYNEELFRTSTIERLAWRLERLAFDAVSRPDVPVLSLEFPDARDPVALGARMPRRRS